MMSELYCPNCKSEHVQLDEYTPIDDEAEVSDYFAQWHCNDCDTPLVEDETRYWYNGAYDAYLTAAKVHGALLPYPGNWLAQNAPQEDTPPATPAASQQDTQP